jgi:hypothetical protein
MDCEQAFSLEPIYCDLGLQSSSRRSIIQVMVKKDLNQGVKGFGARLAYRGNRIRFTPYGGVGNVAQRLYERVEDCTANIDPPAN